VGFIGGGKREVLYTHALRKSVCVVRVCVKSNTEERRKERRSIFGSLY